MDCLKIHHDWQVRIECGAVLLDDQNSGIFYDWKLQITSFNGSEGRYVCSQQNNRRTGLIVFFYCGCNIHFSILIYVLFEWLNNMNA